MEARVLFFLVLTSASLLITGVQSATFTFKNNCAFTVWPGTLTGAGRPQLSSTGFELPSGGSSTLDVPLPWSGRFWGRSQCSTDASGKFYCETGDCASGKVECNGAGAIPPASLAEFTLKAPGSDMDFYDVSLVDGFNVPFSITPQGGTGDCKSSSCPADLNAVCPHEIAVSGQGGTIACKSPCLAFNTPETCCTGAFGTPDRCKPTEYAKLFKDKCPQAYSYAYDDKTSTFTCKDANYIITFCPQ